ncbi:MAG: IS1634 family transposase [bacterium]
MFIKRTTKRSGAKTYVNHLLVESVLTPKGPRHRVVCSLGSLEPAPKDQWLALSRRIESALAGQPTLEHDERVESIVKKVGVKQPARPTSNADAELISIHTDRVETEEHREAGPVHVGHQIWTKLAMDTILAQAGLGERARLLTEVMTLNRLVSPSSEHAMPDWIRRTALADILETDFSTLDDDRLYRNLDRLHPRRAEIEGALAERERALFNLGESLYLYDLTSTYFEGQCLSNPQAQRGYSRDSRPDCKQVVVGLVLDGDGFPKAHEVFDGNRTDRTTVEEMLKALERRTGRKGGATVVVDRGMAFNDNLKQITGRGYHYIVASRQGERNGHLEEFEEEEGWEEIVREPSPRNPTQKKSRVEIKRSRNGDGVRILCWSEGRVEKDRAIREKHEKRLLGDLEKLQERVAKGKLRAEAKVHEAIGRLKERYPRVARYYQIEFDPKAASLSWQEDVERKQNAKKLDGGYLLKTDREDLADEEIWRTYMLLTRVESAFRSMKSPLMERPIFHHLEHRVQTHIFLCVLAYHLLVAIEKKFLDRGIHTSWETLREQLATHQVATIVLPASNGDVLKIRKGATPEEIHRDIYRTLEIPDRVMRPVRTWCREPKGIVTQSHPDSLESQRS